MPDTFSDYLFNKGDKVFYPGTNCVCYVKHQNRLQSNGKWTNIYFLRQCDCDIDEFWVSEQFIGKAPEESAIEGVV